MSHLVTFGDTIIRFAPTGDHRLETTTRFDATETGPESDVAVAAHRLGVEATWISKVPNTPLGERIVGIVRRHGVTTDVVRTDGHRVGLQFVDRGPAVGRGIDRIEDRRDTAIGSTSPEELPLESFRTASVFFTSGVTPALDDRLTATVGSLFVTAKERDITTAFDLRFRTDLWTPEAARETVTRYFPAIDVLVTDPNEAETVLGATGPPSDVVHHIASEWSFETVILWQDTHGAVVWNDASITDRAGIELPTVDPTGARSAFVGGVLAGIAADQSIGEAVHRALGAAAVARTIPGSPVALTTADVDAALATADRPSE